VIIFLYWNIDFIEPLLLSWPVKVDEELVEKRSQNSAKVRGHDRHVEPVIVGTEK
jgi:hypothetical protein